MSLEPGQAQAIAGDMIADLVHRIDEGGMATRWVILAEVVDADGERACWTLTPDGQRIWDTLGLVEYARLLEYANEPRG